MSVTLGAVVADGQTRFAVRAPAASQLWLCQFDDAGTETRHAMACDEGVWQIALPGNLAGSRYGYRAEGEWAPERGMWFDAAKLLVDPYAQELDRRFVWDAALATYGADTAGVVPRAKPFRVVGIFDAGEYEYNSSLALIHIDDAGKMFHLDAPMGLRLKVADRNQAPQVARELAGTMSGDLNLRDWSQQNRTWFAAVQTEKRMMFLILALIIAVAAFNLVSTLVMTVTDKQADIAILRTLGASPFSIMKIFMIQGAIIGLLGTAIGVGLGVLVALNIDVIVPFIEHLFGVKFLSSDVYLISELPSDLQWPDVSIIGWVSVILSFVATLYPSWAAARVRPAEALRYE